MWSNRKKEVSKEAFILISDDEEAEIPVCSREGYDSLNLVPANSRGSATANIREEVKLPDFSLLQEQNETDNVAICQAREIHKSRSNTVPVLTQQNSSQSTKRDFFEELFSRLKPEDGIQARRMLQMFREEVKTGQLPKIAYNRQHATQRLFGCLCLGLFELKYFDQSKTNDDAIKLLKSSDPEQYNQLRRLALKIESQLIKCCPSMESNNSKSYTNRLATIMFNLKDLNNPQLRRKVLSKEMTYVALCTVKQEQLWSDQKRLQKQKEEEKFYLSRQLRVQPQEEINNNEQTLIDFNLMSYRPEKKRPPEKVQEDIDSKIRNNMVKLKQQIKNMNESWPEKFDQDLPPSYAIPLKAHFRSTMENNEGRRLT